MTAITPGTSRIAARARAADALSARGIETAALDARILVEEALGVTATDLALRGAEPVGEAGAERLTRYLARRAAGEPWRGSSAPGSSGGCPSGSRPRPWCRPRHRDPGRGGPRAQAGGSGPHRRSRHRLRLHPGGPAHRMAAGLRPRPRPVVWRVAHRSGNAARNGVADRAAFVAGDWAASSPDPSTSWWRTRPTSPATSSPACPGRCATTIRGLPSMAGPTGSTPTAPSWPRSRLSWRRRASPGRDRLRPGGGAAAARRRSRLARGDAARPRRAPAGGRHGRRNRILTWILQVPVAFVRKIGARSLGAAGLTG